MVFFIWGMCYNSLYAYVLYLLSQCCGITGYFYCYYAVMFATKIVIPRYCYQKGIKRNTPMHNNTTVILSACLPDRQARFTPLRFVQNDNWNKGDCSSDTQPCLPVRQVSRGRLFQMLPVPAHPVIHHVYKLLWLANTVPGTGIEHHFYFNIKIFQCPVYLPCLCHRHTGICLSVQY